MPIRKANVKEGKPYLLSVKGYKFAVYGVSWNGVWFLTNNFSQDFTGADDLKVTAVMELPKAYET